MEFWITLWTLVLFGTMAIFTILAIVVTIGGFSDIKALFRTLKQGHEAEQESGESSGGNS